MFLLAAAFASSLRPVFLVPGLCATSLNATVTERKYWYCPLHTGETVWVDDAQIVPPFYQCVFDAMRLEWDEETQGPVDPPYVKVFPRGPLGDLESISYVDHFFFGTHIVPTYEVFVNRFLDLGYKKGKDLFGLPFDWRYGLLQKPTFWTDIISLIERAVSENGEKAVFVAHSMGCFILHHLLTNKTTAEWRSKHIASVLLVAPSFGGSGVAAFSVYTQRLPKPLHLVGEFPDVLGYLGGLLVHVPNREIFKDVVVFRGPNGQVATGANFTELMRENGVLEPNSQKLLDKYAPFFEHAPEPLDVPTAIAYNSALETASGLDTSRGGMPAYLSGRGDLVVNAEGIEYVCKHWNKAPVVCMDSLGSAIDGNHLTLIYDTRVLDFVLKHAVNDEWHRKT